MCIRDSLTFFDIAGLVKGASKGEGLGNKFLSHIREVDAIIHVVRCFEDDNITHVNNKIDPVDDVETINTELILADLEMIEKLIGNLEKLQKKGDKDASKKIVIANKILDHLSQGKPARSIYNIHEQEDEIKEFNLISIKPIIYVCNVDESSIISGNNLTAALSDEVKDGKIIIISAEIESQISLLDESEQTEFLDSLNLDNSGLNKIISSGYSILNLVTYFTVGPEEARAWTIKVNTLAPDAAGKIHTDFKKGFIRAETVSYNDFIECNGESKARELGKLRSEGKEYNVQDGDVMHFLFNN